MTLFSSTLQRRNLGHARRALYVITAVIAAAGCTGGVSAEDSDVDPVTQTAAALASPPRIMQFVAHEDDDLLFMNPDIADSIRSGATIETVYETAGNSPNDLTSSTGPRYWQTRELGIKAAYAQMTGVPNSWTQGAIPAGGGNAVVFTLDGVGSRVKVVFLRMHSEWSGGGLSGLWANKDVAAYKLESLDEKPGSQERNFLFNGQQMIGALDNLITAFGPDHVRVLDAGNHGYDHTEHFASAQFALAAYGARPGTPAQYRGYNITDLPHDLSSADHQTKWNAWAAYAAFDTGFTCPVVPADNTCYNDPADEYHEWLWRKYTVPTATESYWSFGGEFGDGDVGTAPAYASTLQLADVNGNGFPDACIRRADGVRCALNNGGKFLPHTLFSAAFSDEHGWSPPQYGSTIQLADLNNDGKADVCGRGYVGMQCALANPSGTGFSAVSWWTGDFSDAQGFAASASSYRSIHLADVNGDGFADVCGRGSEGIWCGLNNHQGGFSPRSLWLAPMFSDAQGWGLDQYGATIRFADLDGDGKADVCGRGYYDVWCARANATGTGFSAPSVWSQSFSDAAGFSADSYSQSIRLVDINADGKADLCARGAAGVSCATSNGQTFGAPTSFASAYSDAHGWNASAYGPTVQFADLNRDGNMDICGRGTFGLLCSMR
jgi:LmbE family N-acetylglucosaminyl deacetylase